MRATDDRDDEPGAALYSIKTVSRLTGVNSATIRSWERRYGLIEPAREANGRRSYSEDDIRKLRLVSELVRAGHPIGEIAPMATELLQELHQDADALYARGQRNPILDRLMMAVSARDIDRFRNVLGKALSNLEPLEAVQDVIVPALREIGDRWEQGSIGIGHEHAFSAITKQLLFASVNTLTWKSGGPRIAIATPGSELHEIGSLLAYYLASSYGASCTYIGPNIPAEALAEAAIAVQAEIIALSIVYQPDLDVPAFLRELDEHLPPETPVWLGVGPYANLPNVALPSRVVVFTSFDPFVVRLTSMSR